MPNVYCPGDGAHNRKLSTVLIQQLFFLASIQLLVIRDCCGVQSFRVSLPIFLLSYFM